jgi:hypothetical protein
LQNFGWTFVKKYLICSSILLWLSGCGTSPVSPEASVPDSTPAVEEVAPSPSPSLSDAETTVPDELLISSEGIGLAKLGMTLGELKQILGAETEFVVESPFVVDFDAIAVRQAGEVQFYILYLASETFTDEDVIQGLMTDNPKFLTREAVGAGVAIAQAESAYGKATLSYNTQNEGREYVRFENHPASNLSFGTGNFNQQTAGVYPATTADFNETQEFQPTAAITSVLVVCLAESCVGAGN